MLRSQKDFELEQEMWASIELTFLGPSHKTSGSSKPWQPLPRTY